MTSTGALSYFTYLGGTHADSGTGIAVDSAGNAYVTGTTVSTDFPTAGAVFQPAYGGGNADSFVAKFDPTGATLVYSSYLGGTNTELATGIAVDSSGSAYVTGQTCSEDFPLSNPLQAVPGGNCDAYVAKVSILAGFALNPAGLVFPAQSLNTTSQPQTLTLTNGDSLQTISSITISGTNSGDFTETNTCPIFAFLDSCGSDLHDYGIVYPYCLWHSKSASHDRRQRSRLASSGEFDRQHFHGHAILLKPCVRFSASRHFQRGPGCDGNK